MNFFQALSALDLSGDLRITITKTTPETLAVAVLLTGKKGGDEAAKSIKPLLLRGSGEELDTNFFTAIVKPLQATCEFYSNSDAYMQTLEDTKKQSAVGKANPKSDKEKKYETMMKKADELEKEGRYKEAWMKVPEIAEYPDMEEEIRERKKSLSDQFPPSLF